MRVVIPFILGLLASVPACAQQAVTAGRGEGFQAHPRGYEQATAFDGRITLPTDRGSLELGLVLRKISLAPEHRSAAMNKEGRIALLELPERGVLLLQHRAGEMRLRIGNDWRRPREGEWITIALPATVAIQTRDDTVLFDLIVVAQ